MKSPRIAAYLRISTVDQSHASQRMEMEEYCTRRGWTDVHWFADTASGAKQDRNGLNRMMELVRRGKLDVVIAYKLDRLARSLAHLAQMIGELQALEVSLVIPSQGINTAEGGPAAALQLNVLAAVAQFERELVKERIASGLAAAKQRGVKLGRPAKWQTRIQAVKEHVSRGVSAAEISRILSIPYSTASELVREIRKEHPAD